MGEKISTLAIVIMCLGVGCVWAQNPSDGAVQESVPPSAALTAEDPPITGLDQAPLGSSFLSRSFAVFGGHVSEGVDSNVGQTPGGSSLDGETRAAGSVMLQKFGRNTFSAFDYVGGIVYYPSYQPTLSQVQQVDGEQKFLWRRGQLMFRDQFSYLPEGNFGYGAFGDTGTTALGLGSIGPTSGVLGAGLGGLFSLVDFGALGQTPRINNNALVEVSQGLSSRSALTATFGYGIMHFTKDSIGLIDSNQITAQVGYDHQLTPKTQLAVFYAYQDFQYPNIAGSSFSTQLVSFLYERHFSPHMQLSLGAGPQATIINNAAQYGGSNYRITATARAAFRYVFTRTSLSLSYDRYNTNGSGYFLGATSNILSFAASRPMTRRWTVTTSVGYSDNQQILPGAVAGVLPSSTTAFHYVFAGASAQRQMGPSFSLFFNYQFDDLLFNSTTCQTGLPCNSASARNTASIGIDWHPHPFRLE
ncbi:MAG TPA: hypothetical protein VF753_21775 [Terriglobales bacterium]